MSTTFIATLVIKDGKEIEFERTRRALSTTGWCRPSWPAWRATWTCSCWIGRADGRPLCGLAILADEFLEFLLEIAQHALVALGLLVRQKTNGHPFHHIAAQIETEEKFFALALPLGEQIETGLVELALERLLRGKQNCREILVGARRDGELEKGDEPRMLDMRPVALDPEPHMIAVRRLLGHGFADGAQAFGVQVIDGRSDDVHLGREVVQHGAARQPGAFGDHGGGGARVAQVHQALDGRFDDLRARGCTFLGLPTDGYGRLGRAVARSFSICCHAIIFPLVWPTLKKPL